METRFTVSFISDPFAGVFLPELSNPPTRNMGRTVDQEVHAAFVEFRAKEDDKVYITLKTKKKKKIISVPNRTDRVFTISASLSNASTANRSVQRIPRGRNNTSSNVPVYEVIPTLPRRRLHSQPKPPRPTGYPRTAIPPPPTVPVPLELAIRPVRRLHCRRRMERPPSSPMA